MISALAFVPPADVVTLFETLTGELPNVLIPVLDYFEDTYIGRPDRRGVRRAPLFPIHLWNQYDRVLHSHNRTTNSVEAWHRKIQCLLGVHNPTIFKFVKELMRSQKLLDLEIEQLRVDRYGRNEQFTFPAMQECGLSYPIMLIARLWIT